MFVYKSINCLFFIKIGTGRSRGFRGGVKKRFSGIYFLSYLLLLSHMYCNPTKFYRNFNKKSFTNQTEYGIIESNQFLCFPDNKNRNGDTE